MNCNLPSRKEKIDALLSSPQMPETPSERKYWVQCKGYRCLAVTDASDKWRCFITGKDLSDHILKVYCD